MLHFNFASLKEALMPHPPKPPVEVASRAGRNLPMAVITGLGLLGLVALGIFVRLEIFLLLVVIFLGIGLWEVAGAFLNKAKKIPFFLLLLGQVIFFLLTWMVDLPTGFIGFMATVFIVVVYGHFSPLYKLKDVISGVYILAWIGLGGIFAISLASIGNPYSAKFISVLILLPVASDTGGWMAGVLFGKHPIAPKISPKKSWEGFVGSILLTLLASYLTVGLVIGLSWVWVLAFGFLTPIFATAGDFFESQIKRELGVKDMGNLIPGHGGVMDRLDSILFCAPLFYFLFALSFGLL